MYNISLIPTILTVGIVLTVILLMSLGIYHLIHGGYITVTLTKLAAVLEDTKNSNSLPQSVSNMLPSNTAEVKIYAVKSIEKYSITLTRINENSFISFAYILIGITISAMPSLHRPNMHKDRRRISLFRAELVRRIVSFETDFERVLSAQVEISLINTALMVMYFYLILPLFSVELPFKLTVLVIAFIVRSIPVTSSLISDIIIIILGLDASLYVAITSLVFLVAICKFEYFLNAEIISSETESDT